jgi:hypothetical protein
MLGYTSKLARGDSHRLQRGYTYQLIEPIGRNFDDGFTPEVRAKLSPSAPSLGIRQTKDLIASATLTASFG